MQHYLRKSNPDEVKEEQSFPWTISHEELQTTLFANGKITLLDSARR